MKFPEQYLKELHKQCEENFEKMHPILKEKFGWTIQQSYIATEFLFRPKENYN